MIPALVAILKRPGWFLIKEPIARSDYDTEGDAPFNRAINVYGDGVPE